MALRIKPLYWKYITVLFAVTFFSLPDGSAGERRILPRSRKARTPAAASTETVAQAAVLPVSETGDGDQPEEWTPAPRRLEVPPASTGLYNPFAEISAMVPASRDKSGAAWTGGSAARVVSLPGEQPDFYSAKVEIAPDNRGGRPVTMARDSLFSDSDGRGGGGFGRTRTTWDDGDNGDNGAGASRSRIASRTRRDGDEGNPEFSATATPRIERTIVPRTRRGRSSNRSLERDDSQNRERRSEMDTDLPRDRFGDRTTAASDFDEQERFPSATASRTADRYRSDARIDNDKRTAARWQSRAGEEDRSPVRAVHPDTGRGNGEAGEGAAKSRSDNEFQQSTDLPPQSRENDRDIPPYSESGQNPSARNSDDDDRYREDKYLDLSQIAPAPKDTRNGDGDTSGVVPKTREVPSVPVVPERKEQAVIVPERPLTATPDASLLSPIPLNAGGDWPSAPAPERSGQANRRSGMGEESDYSSFRSVTDDRRTSVEPEPPPLPPAMSTGYDALGEPWRQPPATPPTPAEVERYRQRLENRLLERYNNLPEYVGRVSKVTVVLSRPLETSMDGTMIRAEFDQLVYDPWGKRIAELEREYFAVTFASGGVQQMRSDPSIRIGLDMEKTYSERAPLTADPFGSGPLGTDSAPASDAFGAVPTTAMPSWWRPQGE